VKSTTLIYRLLQLMIIFCGCYLGFIIHQPKKDRSGVCEAEFLSHSATPQNLSLAMDSSKDNPLGIEASSKSGILSSVAFGRQIVSLDEITALILAPTNDIQERLARRELIASCFNDKLETSRSITEFIERFGDRTPSYLRDVLFVTIQAPA
jgi:hypothetical protein